MSWPDDIIQKVWEQGRVVPGREGSVYRKDTCGAWMKRNMYGPNTARLSFGWGIDRIDSQGGDDLSNLQPLQWENLGGKQADISNWDCVVTAKGEGNGYMQ